VNELHVTLSTKAQKNDNITTTTLQQQHYNNNITTTTLQQQQHYNNNNNNSTDSVLSCISKNESKIELKWYITSSV
jgi:hypothetical protein